MCARYSNAAEFSELRLAFDVRSILLLRDWTPRYNIAPSHGAGFEVPIVVLDGGARTLRSARWWLIPSWWKKPLRELPASFNARGEELSAKPFFKGAFRSRRCIVPATGWREFVGPPKAKQPHHFHFGHQVFGFAGLAETWISPEGEAIDSCTLVTTAPTTVAARIHDRMPLVVAPELYAAWLDPREKPESVLAAAVGRAAELPIEIYASDPIGNSTRFEGVEVLAPRVPKEEAD